MPGNNSPRVFLYIKRSQQSNHNKEETSEDRNCISAQTNVSYLAIQNYCAPEDGFITLLLPTHCYMFYKFVRVIFQSLQIQTIIKACSHQVGGTNYINQTIHRTNQLNFKSFLMVQLIFFLHLKLHLTIVPSFLINTLYWRFYKSSHTCPKQVGCYWFEPALCILCHCRTTN